MKQFRSYNITYFNALMMVIVKTETFNIAKWFNYK